MNLRPELASHLRQRLQAFAEGFRQNLAMIGPPGSGKTFQLQQLLAQANPTLMVIFCPLYEESCRSFVHRLLAVVLHAGLPASSSEVSLPTTPAVTPTLERLFQRAEPHLPKTVAAMRSIEPLLSRRLYGEAFNRALDTIPLLIEERQRPCVLIFDEFLFLEELGFGHAFHELGKRVMTWPSTLFILSSSSPYRARTILRERLQLLFGQFELMTLNAVEWSTATAWVQHELRGMRGAKAVNAFLVHWLGAYPWYLTVFLKRLKERALLSKSPEFTEALFLHTAWDILGSPEGTLHQWCLSRTTGGAHTRLGTRAIEALIHVAQGVRTTTEIGKRMGRGGLAEALQRLVEHDVAQRNGMCWMVTDPVLRCWLSTILVVQRADAHADETQMREQFEAYLRGLWSHWTQVHQLGLRKQVENLFAKFCDETVSLDSKTGRLPKFQTIEVQSPEGPGTEAYVVADGAGKRWCAAVGEEAVDEDVIANFETFCRAQHPRPSRKVIITKAGMDQHARLLAKTSNMWVWEPHDLHLLMDLYGHL